MNLLEHYIKEVYSVKDTTERFEKKAGHSPSERILIVKMRVDCYGVEEDVKKAFYLSEWEEAKKKGYYMA